MNHRTLGAIVLLTFGCRGSQPVAADPTRQSVARGPPTLVAAVSADGSQGDFPRRVLFDASDSQAAGDVTYEWSFGDGTLTHDGATTVHTYVGAGTFVATLTLTDESGQQSTSEVQIEVSTPDCPDDEPPLTLGGLDDDALNQVSGIAASRIEPGAYWVHEDIDADLIAAVDLSGNTLSEHDLPGPMVDFEDLDAAIDPATGVPMLFLGDIGDNDAERDEIALWILEEPDPLVDGDIDPIEVRLTYPVEHGPVNAETLLVDPFTLDAYIITKTDDDAEVFVKRAPHVEGGPFELEALGQFDTLDFRATGGDVSPDGLAVVVRGYDEAVHLWIRDGYRPLEEVFAEDSCEVDIHDEDQGEAVTFSLDRRALVTTSEGEGADVWFIGL